MLDDGGFEVEAEALILAIADKSQRVGFYCLLSILLYT